MNDQVPHLNLEDDRIVIQGTVSFATVMNLYQQGIACFNAMEHCVLLDVSNLSLIDSSMVACLICWLKHLSQLGKTFVVEGVSHKLLVMLKLCELDHCLMLNQSIEDTDHGA